MSRRGLSVKSLDTWAILLLASLCVGAPAAAQDPAPPSESTESAAEGEEAPSTLDKIEEILQGEEDVFLDTGYTYDPGDRRDPFKSLLAQQEVDLARGNRPDGVPGLLVDEITVTGIIQTRMGFVAQIQAADKDKSFLLKAGDQLYDGDVVSITRNEVVFKKIVNDPTRLKPFMEVVKKLNP